MRPTLSITFSTIKTAKEFIMYLPRLRKISDVLTQMYAADPDTVITRHFIESLIHSGQLTALKYGDAWLVNLDELYLLLSAEKPDDTEIADDHVPNERIMLTSGEIYRAFLENDPQTIVRKPNLRRFVQQYGIHHFILNDKWIIDFPAFAAAVNPKAIKHHRSQPRLRAHDDAVFDFKRLHPHLHVSLQMIEQQLCSPEVFSIKNGKRWIINYDELELATLKAVNNLPEGKRPPPTYKKKTKAKLDIKPVHIQQKDKGYYTLYFKLTVIEYMVKHNLSYKETVIKFWGIESRKKIRARITLLMNWEAAYKSGGKRALIEQHSPKKHN